MTTSSPIRVQGQPAVVAVTTQAPKAIIPAEVNMESTVSIIGPFLQSPQTTAAPGPSMGVRGVGPPAGRLEAGGPCRTNRAGRALGATRAARPRPTAVSWLSCGVCGTRREFILAAGAMAMGEGSRRSSLARLVSRLPSFPSVLDWIQRPCFGEVQARQIQSPPRRYRLPSTSAEIASFHKPRPRRALFQNYSIPSRWAFWGNPRTFMNPAIFVSH
jgi:hypothetical protein